MQFADCKNIKNTDVNNRQNINLSKAAWATLKNDMDVLVNDRSLTYGSMINHIFQSFYDRAEASISISCERERVHFNTIISETDDSSVRIIDNLVRHHKENLEAKTKVRISRKGDRVLIRLNKETLSILASEDEGQREAAFYTEHYHGKIGVYLKAIVEEYCELPYPEREKVFFRNIINDINEARENKTILKLILYTESTLSRRSVYMKPYTPDALITDSENQYNYLVGMCRTTRTENSWEKISIRLTSIQSSKALSERGSLSKSEREEIQKAISRYGVQYLSANNNIIHLTVRFTPKGEKLYLRSMFHLRPSYESSPEPLVYTFSCPRNQALFYFFKYGRDVKIIEPVDLADEFRRRYEHAAQQYNH